MKEILSHFAIPNEVAYPQPLKIGFINDSYIVRTKQAGEKSYFLQRINHHIFQNVEGLQQNIRTVTDHIRQKLTAAGEKDIERKVLELVPTKDGKLYHLRLRHRKRTAYLQIYEGGLRRLNERKFRQGEQACVHRQCDLCPHRQRSLYLGW